VATLETGAGRTTKAKNGQESTTSRPLRNERGSEGRFSEETTPRGRDARNQVRPPGFIAHGTTVRAEERRGGQFPATSRDSFRKDQSSEGPRLCKQSSVKPKSVSDPKMVARTTEDQPPEGVRNAGRGWHGWGWDLVAARAEDADSAHLER